jgi:hypothetical protein
MGRMLIHHFANQLYNNEDARMFTAASLKASLFSYDDRSLLEVFDSLLILIAVIERPVLVGHFLQPRIIANRGKPFIPNQPCSFFRALE